MAGWVVPGLIDCHSHQVGDIEYAGVPATMTSASEEALIGVRNARTTLAAGFTTVRDVGSYRAFVDVELQHAIDAGWTPGPRMQCCGAMVTCPGGGGDVTGLARDIGLPDVPALRRRQHAARDAREGPGPHRRRGRRHQADRDRAPS